MQQISGTNGIKYFRFGPAETGPFNKAKQQEIFHLEVFHGLGHFGTSAQRSL